MGSAGQISELSDLNENLCPEWQSKSKKPFKDLKLMGFYVKRKTGRRVKELVFKPNFFLCKKFNIEKALSKIFQWKKKNLMRKFQISVNYYYRVSNKHFKMDKELCFVRSAIPRAVLVNSNASLPLCLHRE